MSTTFILLAMIFFHTIDDFCLQPICLSRLKQKSFWESEAPERQYRYDYIAALLIHSFSWSFMIMLPVFISSNFNIGIKDIIMLTANIYIHSTIDNMKANKHQINLIIDQSVHVVQIVITWFGLVISTTDKVFYLALAFLFAFVAVLKTIVIIWYNKTNTISF